MRPFEKTARPSKRAAGPVFSSLPARVGARAFTLVELLVVIAILTVLVAVALPAYNNYTLKSKFAEVVLAAAPTKTAISACVVAGDCVSGGSISLNAAPGATAGTATGLYVPSAANDAPSSPNAVAVMYALEQAWSAYNHYGYSNAVLSSQAVANVQAGMYVMTDPSVANNLCLAVPSGTCYTGTSFPFSVFNQYYAPNAALVAAAASSGGLPLFPCVAASSAGGCAPSTKYAASVSYDAGGNIYATAVSGSNGFAGEQFILQPQYSSGRVDWVESGSCKTRQGGALC
jgi:type IV pilus assembly protein PilA